MGDCKNAFVVKDDPVKEVKLNHSNSDDQIKISEGIETYISK